MKLFPLSILTVILFILLILFSSSNQNQEQYLNKTNTSESSYHDFQIKVSEISVQEQYHYQRFTK
jgi:hypothetical protein